MANMYKKHKICTKCDKDHYIGEKLKYKMKKRSRTPRNNISDSNWELHCYLNSHLKYDKFYRVEYASMHEDTHKFKTEFLRSYKR